MAVAAGFAGWLIPGLGHLILKKFGRALIFFICVASLLSLGVLLRGHVFTPESGDLFDTLGFTADLGAGSFYFLSRVLENGGADVSHASGDYGTRFIVTAGVLNLLCALDAFQSGCLARSEAQK